MDPYGEECEARKDHVQWQQNSDSTNIRLQGCPTSRETRGQEQTREHLQSRSDYMPWPKLLPGNVWQQEHHDSKHSNDNCLDPEEPTGRLPRLGSIQSILGLPRPTIPVQD